MKTTDDIRIQSHKDPAQLEREIDQQRDHIAELVEALGSKLSPGQMFERVLGYGKEGSSEFAGNLSHTIKSNPVPALLAAAGLVWLYTSGRNDSATTTTGTTTGTHKTHLGERMQHVREGTSERIQGVRRTAHDAADSARYRAQRANEGFHHMLEDNPMALGAMGIAAGALLGAMLPVTRKEHELMGEASDRTREQARELARGSRDAAKRGETETTTASTGGDGGQYSSSPQPGMGTSPSRQPPPTT